MLLKISILVIIGWHFNPMALCQPNIHPELVVCLLKVLWSEKLNDIGVAYGLKELNDNTTNELLMSKVLRSSSSLGIPVRIGRSQRGDSGSSLTKIILSDSMSSEEIAAVNENIGKATSKVIYLMRSKSQPVLQSKATRHCFIVIGRYSTEHATFSILSHGSQLSKAFATWSLNKGFQGGIFSDDRRIIASVESPITVYCRHDPPFTMKKIQENGSMYLEGYLFDLFTHTSEKLNFSFEVNMLMTFEDMDRECMRDLPDIILSPLGYPPESVTYFYAGAYEGIGFQVYLYRGKDRMSFWSFMCDVHISCFEVVVLIAFISVLLLYLSGNDLVDSVFSMLAITLYQARITWPSRFSGRLTYVSFTISLMVFSLYCIGSYISIYIYPPETRITYLDLQQNYFKTGIIKHVIAEEVLYFSIDYMFVDIMLVDTASYTYRTIPEALSNIASYGTSFFIEKERVEPFIQHYCCIREIPLDLNKYLSYIFVKKNSPYSRMISKEFTKLREFGVISYGKNKWWPKIRNDEKNYYPVTVSDINGIMVLFGSGLVLAILIFCIEKRIGTSKANLNSK